jgi:hypothetical protein
VTASLTAQIELTLDEAQVLAARVGGVGFPTVLAIRTRHATVDGLRAARDRATETLTRRGVIVDGGVDDSVAAMLQAMHRPDRELSMRLVTPSGIARVGVVRRAASLVVAHRVDDVVTLCDVAHDGGLRDAIDALRVRLPAANAAPITPVSAPTDDMAEALSGTHDAAELADRIRALGAEPRAAMQLGAALASREAFAEIVFHVLVDDEDRVSRATAVVGVFYTRRGRIVAAPSASPSGQLWSTFKPGTDHALSQAIGQLVDTSSDRWGDS